MIGEPVKVCILGATGFIGASIGKELTAQGIEWVGITRSETAHPNLLKAELTDLKLLKGVIEDYPIVVNALGHFKPNDFREEPEKTRKEFNEVVGLLSQLLSSSKVDKLLHISSAGTIYGNCEFHKTEADKTEPQCHYGKAKLYEELALKKVMENKGVFNCARVTNPYGNQGTKEHGFVDVLLKQLLSGGSFNTYKLPLYERDFIHVSDMALSLVTLLKKSTSHTTINIGRGVSTNLVELLKGFEEFYPNQITYNLSSPIGEVKKSKVNVDKLKNILDDDFQFIDVENYLKERLIK